MGLLTRLLEKLDDNLHVDIPQPRDPAEPVVRHLTPPGYRFEIAGYWSHCKCCKKYTPQPCTVIHTGPCDKPECDAPEDVA